MATPAGYSLCLLCLLYLLCLLCLLCLFCSVAAAGPDYGCGERVGGCWDTGPGQVHSEQPAGYVFQGNGEGEGEGEGEEDLQRKWGFEWGFSGISTFAHLPHIKCLTHPGEKFDIAIVGAPFDTAVSYRPGARFGPRAIRAASSRQTSFRGFNPRAGFNPYTSWARILDCGDIPITPFDNALALKQMAAGFSNLLRHPAHTASTSLSPHFEHPKLITLGGDHSLALPALRALSRLYGEPIAVLHFDAHLDTWNPAAYPSYWVSHPSQSSFNHGSMFWLASAEGLIQNGSSVHAGLRTRLSGPQDWTDDDRQGFLRITADDIDDMGTAGVVATIMQRIGPNRRVYLSVDIDVLDPGLAPGTGTPEPGGWTSRELIRILRGVQDLNVVGADVVEVAPAYDGAGEQTALAAAQVVFEVLTSMVHRGLRELKVEGTRRGEEAEEAVGEQVRGAQRDEL